MDLTYESTPEFEKQLKRLLKKYPSLREDLKTVKIAVVELLHVKKLDNKHSVKIPGYENPHCEIYKIRKMACKALKGRGNRSGLRVLYAYHANENRVVFIEIYFKADQPNESRELIKKYIDACINGSRC
jgi:mRNA-degrading endonuclease RelE of RelBE toxin-antitoxin system